MEADTEISKPMQEVIKTKIKMLGILRTEGQPNLVVGVFREALRQLANELDSTYQKVSDDNRTRVRTDLIGVMESLKTLELEDDSKTVLLNKIANMLLSKCGYDINEVKP